MSDSKPRTRHTQQRVQIMNEDGSILTNLDHYFIKYINIHPKDLDYTLEGYDHNPEMIAYKQDPQYFETLSRDRRDILLKRRIKQGVYVLLYQKNGEWYVLNEYKADEDNGYIEAISKYHEEKADEEQDAFYYIVPKKEYIALLDKPGIKTKIHRDLIDQRILNIIALIIWEALLVGQIQFIIDKTLGGLNFAFPLLLGAASWLIDIFMHAKEHFKHHDNVLGPANMLFESRSSTFHPKILKEIISNANNTFWKMGISVVGYEIGLAIAHAFLLASHISLNAVLSWHTLPFIAAAAVMVGVCEGISIYIGEKLMPETPFKKGDKDHKPNYDAALFVAVPSVFFAVLGYMIPWLPHFKETISFLVGIHPLLIGAAAVGALVGSYFLVSTIREQLRRTQKHYQVKLNTTGESIGFHRDKSRLRPPSVIMRRLTEIKDKGAESLETMREEVRSRLPSFGTGSFFSRNSGSRSSAGSKERQSPDPLNNLTQTATTAPNR